MKTLTIKPKTRDLHKVPTKKLQEELLRLTQDVNKILSDPMGTIALRRQALINALSVTNKIKRLYHNSRSNGAMHLMSMELT